MTPKYKPQSEKGCYICYFCYMLIAKTLSCPFIATFCYISLQNGYKEGGFATYIYVLIDMLQSLSLYIGSFPVSCKNVSVVAAVTSEMVSRVRERILTFGCTQISAISNPKYLMLCKK